ncbi:stage III sporulation AC/AD family protein [Sporosarcina sp. P35]|uniref:stage III sporulation AC/AD family protein n=1 Tax=Sporosarcina sp. P35 TaxID=2048246 RepID=UPI001E641DB4|nr:stage III sporulation AC/AD family protein [Sporosarcina sp. P35]
MYLLLLLLSFAAPALHPILYTTMFLMVSVYVLLTVLVPFGSTLLSLTEKLPAPYATLLVVSAGLYYMAEVLSLQMKDEGYGAFGQLFQTTMKIVIMSLWLPYITQLIETIHALIPW